MVEKKPSTDLSPRDSRAFLDELQDVQGALAQIACRHKPTARICHGPWQESLGGTTPTSDEGGNER
jgi:hypothetical protein